jgi:hypothetical protein
MAQLIERQISVVEALQAKVLEDPTNVELVNSLSTAVLDLTRLRHTQSDHTA